MSPLILDDTTKERNPEQERKRFAIRPAKSQDIRRLVDIEFHAFENERVNQLLSYRDYKKPAHFERTVSIYQNDLMDKVMVQRRDQRSKMLWSDVFFKKVIDTGTDDIVSFSKFEMKMYSEEELQSREDSGHEDEPIMNRNWFALNERLRRQYVGLTEHCYISMLATDPKYQHYGAGTMLLGEILLEADDAGVEVYLEATDTARPFYEKHGFEAITELKFDPAEYGVKGIGFERQTVMVRGGLGREGDWKTVRTWDVAVAQAKATLQK